MRILIIKLGATGDVVRTTPLLRVLKGEIDWLTDDANVVMLIDNPLVQTIIPMSRWWDLAGNTYDMIINLEDKIEVKEVLENVRYRELFGVYFDKSGNFAYTDSSRGWFDLSLISRHGKEKADELKLMNRKSYQELIFSGLGYQFNGEKYLLPRGIPGNFRGDLAIAPKAGSVWPMKNWAYYDEVKDQLQKDGYSVNYLPMRKTLREHIGDVQNHGILVSGDSLPMHIALGSGIPCLTIFICTSPWEIYDYNLQRKVVSSRLDEYFYKRDYDSRATMSISKEEILEHVYELLGTQIRTVFEKD